ncbi:antibiotic biosynthesis monooxygenase [Desertimonas flava]|uniref:antibiotic biosynthesis monooxygenase n=1 Tax=Desertimonas flava TaxID=2064846 RepID=UPI000E355977|nr:antibiotic biosynthesis monooxygenase [Desertimonas flava]
MPDSPVTFVNVFDVEPADQSALVDLLTEAIDEVIRQRPGFVGARVLASDDGRTVINEATWTDAAAVAATQADPAAAGYAARTAALATPRPGLYRVHSTAPRQR